jgi:uncharacterized Zn finger protein (UPF0148 family)
MGDFDTSDVDETDSIGQGYTGLNVLCPNCGSSNIIYEEIDGYLSCKFCKDCGYKKPKEKVETESPKKSKAKK